MPSLTARLLIVASLAAPAAVGFAVPAAAVSSGAPVVTRVMPVQGSTVGYADVVIEGRRFTGVSSVVIGGIKATRVRALSSHRLAVSAPPHGHGVKNVVVHTSHGTSALTKATTFHYVHATSPGTWTSARAALPSDAGQGDYLRLVDTSCPAVSTCYSVGRIANSSDDLRFDRAEPGDRAVIRTRAGSSYSIMDVPLPADADLHPSEDASAEVDSIDCPAVGSCTAVGLYAATNPDSELGYNLRVLLLTLTGGVWHAQAAPTGSVITSTSDVGFGEAPEISCAAPGVCLVGAYLYVNKRDDSFPDYLGVFYRLSGTTWTGARPVVPSGAKTFGVEQVSCPTTTFCAAALASLPNSYVDVLANNRLTPVAIHAPSGTKQANYRPDILDLKCPAAQGCVAVVGNDRGNAYDTDFVRMIGSTLDGQAHHRIPTPGDIDTSHEVGYRPQYASTLVCPSTTTCFATDQYRAVVGYYKYGTDKADQSVVARLAGSTVHLFVMPEVAGTGYARTELANLACPSVTSCLAVGSRFASSYTGVMPAAAYVTFADGVWTPGSLPTVPGQPSPSEGQFADLDCPAVGQCFADADYLSNLSDPKDSNSYSRSTDLDAVLTPN